MSVVAGSFHTLERLKETHAPSKKSEHYPKLARLSAPHIESFDSLFSFGGGPGLIDKAVADIGVTTIHDGIRGETPLEDRNKIEFWVSSLQVGKPSVDMKGSLTNIMYPMECRERGVSYKAKMEIKLNWRVNGGPVHTEVRSLGSMPIMVRSIKCNLNGMSPRELIIHHEDAEEFGGYFITNGIERLIRLLIVPRRNLPTAIIRGSFQNRGPTYSKFGVSIRSVRPDQSSQTITMHYCTDGAVTLRFSYRKNEYMVPVILVLRALCDASDREIFERITMGVYSNTFLTDRVELLLRSFRKYSVYNRKQSLAYIGSKFAVMLDSPDDAHEEEVGIEFLRKIMLVHLDDNRSKFNLIIFMLQKLYSLVAGDCAQDNPDALQFQETLLAGHLFSAIIKEKISDWLTSIKINIMQDMRKIRSSVNFQDRKYILRILNKTSPNADIGQKLEYFLATGNLISGSGLDLQQVSGFTVIAEKLNFYRYLSHFRSIHRGAYFAELKTTTVRKLLPESWGFMCPVHTPDGAPCGLLNHLSHTCEIVTKHVDVSSIPKLVAALGAGQLNAIGPRSKSRVPNKDRQDDDDDDAMDADDDDDDENDDDDDDDDGDGNNKAVDPVQKLKNRNNMTVSVQLDGKVIGWCNAKIARHIADTLRDWKVRKQHNVPLSLEIGFVPVTSGGQYPGLYMFSSPARMIRSVKYLPTGTPDYVGPFEQVYMNIACMNEDVVPGITTHQEHSPTDMLSVVANFTPFCDFNQSPRNMYQCQMGKQTMGTPAQNIFHRTDNKLYRLQTGQSPIVRPNAYEDYGMDGYPHGTNAVVCVISYTGYDMEDASIIAKSSHERGYGYGTVYKGEWVDLSEFQRRGEAGTLHFGWVAPGREMSRIDSKKFEHALEFVGLDGLPIIGVRLKQGDPMYAYVDDVNGQVRVGKYKGQEEAYVDQVRVIGTDSGKTELQKIHIRLRIPRSPTIGDKFSSRHGQKGVVSQKWPSVDMPFSETGIIPDVIINPHAFPSRMTIGMFVESIAAKAGALHGHSQDATPFKFNEEHAAADFFGQELLEAGFNYHGNEAMYSGITGEEFKADIYIGIVYYQRLRHMVSDKYQVRTTGPVHNVTQQPVKGRKRAGGIRFGEMERDSLLAHGVSFLLKDRLMNCSDYSQCYVCGICGSILSTVNLPAASIGGDKNSDNVVSDTRRVECLTCGTSKGIDIIEIPYVFRYLCTELVSMNVRLRLEISHS